MSEIQILSDEQIKRIWCECKSIENHEFCIEFARAILRASGVQAQPVAAQVDAQREWEAVLDDADDWAADVIEDQCPMVIRKHLETRKTKRSMP